MKPQGLKLKAGKGYWWRVRIWDANNNETLWSEPAYFSLGPDSWGSRNLVGIIFYTRKVLLTSHYEKRLFEHASQPRVAGSDIRLLSYLWS